MNRADKAAAIRHNGIPGSFNPLLSAEPAGRPAMPGTLTADEATEVNKWVAAYAWGAAPSDDLSGYSAHAQTKIVDFLAYFTSAAYLAWKSQNDIYTECAYRLALADGIETLVATGTIPKSLDPTGAGSNAPSSIASNPKLLSYGASSLDISATLGHSPYTVAQSGNLYITEIILSIWAATISTGQHFVEIRRNGSGLTLWGTYMPPPVTGQPVTVLQVRFKTPIFLFSGDNVYVVFTLVGGSATGYKGAYQWGGRLE